MGSLFPRKDDVFDFVPRLFDRDREFFQPFLKQDFPRVDVKEEKDHLVIDAELPGFEKEDVTVTYKDHELTIEAKKEEEKAVEEGTYLRKERYSGAFRRQFHVGDVDEKEIKGRFEKGVLTLTVPKTKEDLTKDKRYQIELS